MLRSINVLLGYGVEATDGRIGVVRDILFNQHGGTITKILC